MNISVAITDDFNGDGYPDLFIGGRQHPPELCLPRPAISSSRRPRPFHRHRSRETTSPHIGMVTAPSLPPSPAAARKISSSRGNGCPRDLQLVAITLPKSAPIRPHSLGWWQTVGSADSRRRAVRPDPRQYRREFLSPPRSTHPVRLWINDFDQNGIPDKIMTPHGGGKDIAGLSQHEMERQLPSSKKQSSMRNSPKNPSASSLLQPRSTAKG